MALYLLSNRDADLKLNQNPFVETALTYALTYIYSITSAIIQPSSITILADNDYYSTATEDTASGRRFHDFGVPISKAHKTGLGSSAALVTAFTAAVLSYYLPKEVFNLEDDISRRRLHNLAQASHCAAQGKVGSGFDVASAVYGSCLYRRFSPSILSSNLEPGTKGFAARLRDTVTEAGTVGSWDTEVRKDAVKVPRGLRLIMCDVDCGSQTPGMVKKVLAWRVEQASIAEKIWDNLHESNIAMAEELKRVAESGEKDYAGLRRCINTIRNSIRKMGDSSGVPIEPLAQTRLIDACSQIDGVVGGVVPGAGGYDAVALLIEDKQDVVTALAKLFEDWKFDITGDVNASAGGRVSMLGVREEMQGVRYEKSDMYAKEK